MYILWFLGDLMRDLWQLWFHEIIMIAAFFRRLPRIIAVLAWHSSQLPHWICMSSYIFVCYKKSWNFWSKLFLIDNSIWQSNFFDFNSSKSLKSESLCNIDIRHAWICFSSTLQTYLQNMQHFVFYRLWKSRFWSVNSNMIFTETEIIFTPTKTVEITI